MSPSFFICTLLQRLTEWSSAPVNDVCLSASHNWRDRASEVRLVTSYKHIIEEGGELEKLSLTRTMPHDVSFGLRRNIDIAFRAVAVGVLAAKRL